jgi:glycerol-3-phosphate O-acyltransferase / dihydroxyacetone phosphate acyltransferase
MAEASWKRRIIGDLAWALGVVPVKRAQDDARAGSGKIKLQKPIKVQKDGEEQQAIITVEGTGTNFSQELAVGDKIRPPGTAFGLKVKSIESDQRMVVEGLYLPDDFPVTLFEDDTAPVTYDLMKHTPLTKVFEKVLDRLVGGGALGIFPEGGSHDRTDLLPLKVGISLIAYSALEKDGLNIPIVPVGLSYFRAHRWRGRCVVEYGRPFYIDPSTLDDFKAGGVKRHKVCNAFLEEVEKSMRSVILSAPDYETLELIHTARRLYQRKVPMDTVEKQDLIRRFVEGYKRLLLMTDGKPSPEWLELQRRIVAYRNELKDLGIKDHQVPALKEEHLGETLDIEKVDGDNVLRFLQFPYNIVHKLLLILFSAIPIMLLNLPVGVMAGIYSERRRKKALANSKVKIKGFDVSEKRHRYAMTFCKASNSCHRFSSKSQVMLTEKVLFCIVMVPTLWIVYGLILILCTDWEGPTIALVMMSMPVFAYTGIEVAEAGIIDWYDLRPNIMRLFPSARKRLAALPAMRKDLQDDLRAFIRSIGPALGEIYYGAEVDWTKIQEQAKQCPVDVKKTK